MKPLASGSALGVSIEGADLRVGWNAERSQERVGKVREWVSRAARCAAVWGSPESETRAAHTETRGHCVEKPEDAYSKSRSVRVECHEESRIATRVGCRESRGTRSSSATTTMRLS